MIDSEGTHVEIVMQKQPKDAGGSGSLYINISNMKSTTGMAYNTVCVDVVVKKSFMKLISGNNISEGEIATEANAKPVNALFRERTF